MARKSEEVIFALRPDSILVGDIILTSAAAVISYAIRRFTESDLSHAAICTRPGMLLEATGTGVLRRSAIGTYATRIDWIRVLRPKKPLAPNVHGLGIAECAESIYGHEYSVRGALACHFPVFGGSEDGGVFCSQLVAQAYLLYGLPLLLGKSPSQINPGMLLKSSELSDVTNSCIRRLGSVSDADVYKLVVETATQELPIVEMRMNRRAFDAIQERLGGRLPEQVQSLPELIIWLSASSSSDVVKRSDPVILEILEREDMFRWHDEFPPTPRC